MVTLRQKQIVGYCERFGSVREAARRLNLAEGYVYRVLQALVRRGELGEVPYYHPPVRRKGSVPLRKAVGP